MKKHQISPDAQMNRVLLYKDLVVEISPQVTKFNKQRYMYLQNLKGIQAKTVRN